MAVEKVVETLKHVDVAFVTLFGGLLLGRLAGKLCARLLKEAELDRVAQGFSDALGYLVSLIVYVVTFVLVLQQFSLTSIAFALLGFVAVVTACAVVLFAVADLGPNLVLGFLMRKKLARFLGKRVRVGKAEGQLVSTGWVDCVLKDKDIYAVPYRYLRKEKVRAIR